MLINSLLSPECAEQPVCQALVGTSWHRQFCWACAGKTRNEPFGNSYAAFINLPAFTISKCAAEPPAGSAAQPGECVRLLRELIKAALPSGSGNPVAGRGRISENSWSLPVLTLTVTGGASWAAGLLLFMGGCNKAVGQPYVTHYVGTALKAGAHGTAGLPNPYPLAHIV